MQASTTRFEQVTERLNMHAEWTAAEGYHRDADGWEHQRYRFTWRIAGETLGSNVAYRAGLALDEPTERDLLAAVVSDAQCAAATTPTKRAVRGTTYWPSGSTPTTSRSCTRLSPNCERRNGRPRAPVRGRDSWARPPMSHPATIKEGSTPMQVNVNVEIVAPDGSYGTTKIACLKLEGLVPEIDSKTRSENALSVPDLETLREHVARRLRDAGRDLAEQLDVLTERALERAREERRQRAQEERERATADTF